MVKAFTNHTNLKEFLKYPMFILSFTHFIVCHVPCSASIKSCKAVMLRSCCFIDCIHYYTKEYICQVIIRPWHSASGSPLPGFLCILLMSYDFAVIFMDLSCCWCRFLKAVFILDGQPDQKTVNVLTNGKRVITAPFVRVMDENPLSQTLGTPGDHMRV